MNKVATFKERFSALFDESGKTIVDLSKELHVSNQTVSAWKLGERSPKEPTIIAIANYFGVSVQWLMGFDVDKSQTKEVKPKTNEVRLLIQGLNKLSKKQQEQALNVMRAMFAQYADFFKENDDNES